MNCILIFHYIYARVGHASRHHESAAEGVITCDTVTPNTSIKVCVVTVGTKIRFRRDCELGSVWAISYHPPMKLRKGSVFSRVCHSVHSDHYMKLFKIVHFGIPLRHPSPGIYEDHCSDLFRVQLGPYHTQSPREQLDSGQLAFD